MVDRTVARHMHYRLIKIGEAILLLKEARDHLVAARCPRAADKVRAALKSAEGAARHAQGIQEVEKILQNKKRS